MFLARGVVAPPLSPDLKPIDYYIWSVLETYARVTSYITATALKMSMKRAWATLPQKTVRATMEEFRSAWRL